MLTIDEVWLFERGGLHDAWVDSICTEAGNIHIRLNDEWVNERGLSMPEDEERPVVLTFFSAVVVSGVLDEISGGRISKATKNPAGDYSFIFQDREALLIQAGSAEAVGLESQS